MKYSFTILACIFITQFAAAQNFIPKDTIIGNNFFQVEFSDDSRSMTWCEQIPLSGGRAKVWYADMNLETGLPDLANKQLIDTIQGQGWPYWGKDKTSVFFLYMNQKDQIFIARKMGFNTLTKQLIAPGNITNRSLLNVSSDSTKNYFWVDYTVINPNTSGRDSLFCFRSDKPSEVIFIASEVRSPAGSIYELTFARWLKDSEILAFPFRGNPQVARYDIKFWDGKTGIATQVTNDPLGSHVDDLPFRVPNLPNDLYMFSSKNSIRLTIYQQINGIFKEIEGYDTPTTINPATLTSFEPFTINNQTYGAYQVFAGGGIPGNTKGEIWLRGILGTNLITKISTFDGVTVDPEYVIGQNKVWIYYYGKAINQTFFDLHRCETPFASLTTAVENLASVEMKVYPNPTSDYFVIESEFSEPMNVTIFNTIRQQVINIQTFTNQQIDISNLQTGIYVLRIADERGQLLNTQFLEKY